MSSKEKIWENAIGDINEILSLVPEIEANSEEEAIQEIIERQSTEDAFVDEDYLPEQESGLTEETVGWLLENEVEVPATWQARYEKATLKNKEVKKQNKTKIQEEEKKMKTTKEVKENKKSAPKTEAKKAAPKAAPKAGGSKIKNFLAFIEPLIEKGILETELLKKAKEKFPETSEATFKVQLYAVKSPKKMILGKPVVKDESGKLSFGK